MPPQTIVSWIVPLAGHRFDLEDLPLYLDGAPVSVVDRDGTYFISIPATLAGQSHENVLPIAEEYLGLLNGLTATILTGIRPVALADGGYFGIGEGGTIVHTVVAVSGAELRTKGGHVTLVVGGVQLPDSRRGALTSLLRGAVSNRSVANALRILGRSKPTWSELYLAFELVEASIGRRMYEENWITRADATLFSRTANSYAVLGIESRHGKESTEPPAEPMPYSDAISKIRALVASWVKNPDSEVRA